MTIHPFIAWVGLIVLAVFAVIGVGATLLTIKAAAGWRG